jgi:hypothetical protein
MVILKESVSYILYDFIRTCSPIAEILFACHIFLKHIDRMVGFTCEDCIGVFDEIWTANVHHDQNGHKIKFWITGRR